MHSISRTNSRAKMLRQAGRRFFVAARALLTGFLWEKKAILRRYLRAE